MSIMDLASALHGGPPGGPGGPGLPPPGPDPDDVPGRPDDVYDTPMQALDVAEHAIQAFIRMDHDAPDKAQAAKALVIVTGLKGSHQTDAMAGGGKSLVRALQGGGGIGVPGG